MALKDRAIGFAYDQVLRHERNLRRSFSRRAGLDVFLQINDAHGLLLVQLLLALMERIPNEELRVHVIPPPRPASDPEPELRLPWTITDSKLLAAHRGLEGPKNVTLPSEDVVARAQRILLVQRRGRAQLALALEVLRCVWADDLEGLEALGREHGTLPPSQLAARLSENQELLVKLGHYQGSTVLHQGEWFWGVDRFEMLERSLGRTDSVLGWAETTETPPGVVGEDGRAKVELWWSFRSPYSFLILEPMRRVAARPNVDVVFRPVLPMIMRGLPVPFSKRMYILPDCKRLAEEMGVPFGYACDPAGAGVERSMAIYMEAHDMGRGDIWIREAAEAIWTEAANLARDEEFRPVVERAGLSWSDAQRGIANEKRWRDMVETNRSDLFAAGLWGVPSLRVGNLAMWGQDRVPILERILDAAGV